MTAGNTLQGLRLILRALSVSDAEDLFAAVDSSREILKRRFLWVSQARSVDDEIRFIEWAAQAAARKESFVWAFFESKSQRLAGVMGLHTESPDLSSVRLGAWTRRDRQDRGYATQAGRMVIEHGFQRLSLHRIYARIDPANRSGRRLLKKLGFRYEGCLKDDMRLNGRWVDQECWGLLRTEWKR